jgi:hypothetical protein
MAVAAEAVDALGAHPPHGGAQGLRGRGRVRRRLRRLGDGRSV